MTGLKEKIPSHIKSAIESYVDTYLPSSPLKFPRANKVVHESLWGTQILYEHEIALLDTPLIQRLRQIHQTAFAYLTYPSSTHTRFEHTLGVMHQCEKLLHYLGEKYAQLQGKKIKEHFKIGSDTIQKLRLAALLHDCGHGPFSHTTEEIYEWCDDMQKMIRTGGIYEGYHPHEVLSYLIVTSERFKRYYEELRGRYGFNFDNNDIADIIVGNPKDRFQRFETDVLSGPFDADKLDYLFRDGLFCGLPMTVDLDRLWFSLEGHEVDTKKHGKARCLTVAQSGVTALEQIMFSKIAMYSSVYHHHKSRACDCMVAGIVEYCRENSRKICGRDLENSTDFLYLTDNSFFAEADKIDKKDPLHDMIHSLLYRRLLKRAIVITMASIDIEDDEEKRVWLERILNLARNPKYTRTLAKQIWEEAGRPCSPHQIWVDLPDLPSGEPGEDAFVNIGTLENPILSPLKDFMPIAQWINAYALNKWRGHVFCPENSIQKIAKAAYSVLESEFRIKFNQMAFKFPHIDYYKEVSETFR